MREDTKIALKKFGISVSFSHSQKVMEDAEKALDENETVLFAQITNLFVEYIGMSKKEKYLVTVFLTDKKILLTSQLSKAIFSETIQLNEIISIHCLANKFIGGYLEIQCSTKMYSIEVAGTSDILKKIHEEFETAINNYKAQQSTQSSHPQPNSSQSDIADQIEKLAQLRDKGIITEEEFQAKKTDLLSRM